MTKNTADHVADYFFTPFDPSKHRGPFFVLPYAIRLWANGMLTRRGAELAYWARKKKNFYHTTDGPTDYGRNFNHIFYFRTEKMMEEFHQVINQTVDKVDADEGLFKTAAEFLSQMQQGEAKACYFLKHKVAQSINTETLLCWYWCRDNLEGDMWLDTNFIIFEKESDLIAFKLKFC